MNQIDINSIETERIDWDDTQVVDRIVRQYENYPKALQKECIQNSWDARNDRKNGVSWKIIIDLHRLDSKNHLVIEDFGTKGMNEERLYAFLSLWKPHKDHTDAGGQGQGKFVLMRPSKLEIIIVESIDQAGNYRCRFLQRGRKSKEASSFGIQNLIPNSKPLDHQGTKIWIYDIQDNYLKEIKSKNFIEFIIESWWQILGNRFNADIKLFGQKIIIPDLLSPVEEVTLFENLKLKDFGRIKRLNLSYYEEQIPELFRGIRVQRANMMITKVPFEVYDREYQGRFSGYIEFDSDLEEQMKSIEKTDHCGFLYESPWKEIKALVKEEADKFISKIIPSREHQKSLNIRNLSEVIKKANQIINDYCPEILGGGTVVPPFPPKPKLPLRIKYLLLNKREAKFGDKIKASSSILNGEKEDKKVSLYVELKRSGVRISEEEYSFKIRSGQAKLIRLSEIKLSPDEFEKGKYTLRATLRNDRHDIDTKSTSFYLESKREPVKRGFIREVRFYESEEPLRNKSVRSGTLEVNLKHNDFINIYSTFEDKPNILNKQIGFFIMKICLDEAVNELFKLKLREKDNRDLDDVLQELKETKDRMYFDVYA